MRAVIQRVKEAEVIVDGPGGVPGSISKIGHGVLTLLGVEHGDDDVKLEKLIQKICNLRIFEDKEGKMNLSLLETGGAHMIVSQFTLAADCKSGRRPSFIKAAPPNLAKLLYEKALLVSEAQGIMTVGGVFQAHMKVSIVNDGPVTFVLEV
ncbi:MAG: D-aminoacyl-tRNA deacylase [Bdellovibrionota bacterium]